MDRARAVLLQKLPLLPRSRKVLPYYQGAVKCFSFPPTTSNSYPSNFLHPCIFSCFWTIYISLFLPVFFNLITMDLFNLLSDLRRVDQVRCCLCCHVTC